MTARWRRLPGRLKRALRSRSAAGTGSPRQGQAALPPIEERLQQTLRKYWIDRGGNRIEDNYAGVMMRKLPEDLRVYEHLLWDDRANVVIEIGTLRGASALWVRDRLRTMAAYGVIDDYHVISIDVDAERARPHLDGADPRWEEHITLVSSDICDAELPARVAELLPRDARCFVIEDSAHIDDTTMAALEGFAPFVAPGGFFIVEDSYVDIEQMRRHANQPRGVLPAVADWLATPAGQQFTTRRDLELYGLTCFPKGVLQRRDAGATDRSAVGAAAASVDA
jgi:cephalosporin hydroxylase